MTRTVVGAKRVTMDPLKHSPALGGIMAFLGIDRCLPLLHGAQGCSAFAKALLTKHFREPIPLQTTALTEVSTILGTTDSLLEALATISERHRPEVIGVLTTSVPEVCGEDLAGAMETYRKNTQGRPGGVVDSASAGPGSLCRPLVIAASASDLEGGLSEGWSAALTAMIETALAEARSMGTAGGEENLVAVPVGVSMTAADLDDLAALFRAFGLRPVIVPDLSRSIDGHLAPAWTPLTTGGTTRAALLSLATAPAVCSIGATATDAAIALAARSGADLVTHGHCCGLTATDALVADLIARSGRRIPQDVLRWRARLADGLLDSHFVLGGARVAVAAEPEYLAGVATLLAEAGARIVAAVAPTASPIIDDLPCDEVIVGDLVDLEERAVDGGAELVIASSHARDLAGRLGAAHLVAGFPIHDRLGAQLRGSHGYRGGLHLLFEAANRLLDHRSERRTR